MSGSNTNPWLEYVREYREKHPEISYKEALKAASKSYRKMTGGFDNIPLSNAQLRYEAGVSSLNSGLTDINRSVLFK